MELIPIECIIERLTFCEAILALVGFILFWISGGEAARGKRYWEPVLLCAAGIVAIPILGYFIIAGCQKYFCPEQVSLFLFLGSIVCTSPVLTPEQDLIMLELPNRFMGETIHQITVTPPGSGVVIGVE